MDKPEYTIAFRNEPSPETLEKLNRLRADAVLARAKEAQQEPVEVAQ
ncbi:MAG: hypothetical protein R6U37_07025 [Dehalococcoidia bacterium]